MIGVAASFDHPSAGFDEPLDIYVHGYISARLMNLSRKHTSAASGGVDDTGAADGAGANGVEHAEGEEQGIPVTVTATKVDGFVLSLTPYTHDVNYRSAMVVSPCILFSSRPQHRLLQNPFPLHFCSAEYLSLLRLFLPSIPFCLFDLSHSLSFFLQPPTTLTPFLPPFSSFRPVR
jgi:Pyridoxamine 5'-phosphate oxidase